MKLAQFPAQFRNGQLYSQSELAFKSSFWVNELFKTAECNKALRKVSLHSVYCKVFFKENFTAIWFKKINFILYKNRWLKCCTERNHENSRFWHGSCTFSCSGYGRQADSSIEKGSVGYRIFELLLRWRTAIGVLYKLIKIWKADIGYFKRKLDIQNKNWKLIIKLTNTPIIQLTVDIDFFMVRR